MGQRFGFDKLAVRQIIGRLLSGAPFFVLAIAGVWATAFPDDAQKSFWALNVLLSDAWTRAAVVAAVVIYFVGWWWSSLPAEHPRKSTQRALVDFHAKLDASQRNLRSAASETEFSEQKILLEAVLSELHDWVVPNMSQAAWDRLVSPYRTAGGWTYSGLGPSDPNFYNLRDNVLSLNQARIGILDEMIKHDAWDR